MGSGESRSSLGTVDVAMAALNGKTARGSRAMGGLCKLLVEKQRGSGFWRGRASRLAEAGGYDLSTCDYGGF